MAVFTIDTLEAIDESEIISIKNNLLSHKEFGLNFTLLPYQDNALGLYLMNSENI